LKIRAARILDSSGIPPRYLRGEYHLPSWASKFVVGEKGLCLVGKTGVRKTTIVCRIAQGKIYNNPFEDWQYISFPAFLMELRGTWSHDEGLSAYQIVKRVAHTPKLIIDDLGAVNPTPFAQEATYYLLNTREQFELTTYITTNFKLKDLDHIFHPFISSRVAGLCDVKAIDGEDLRIRKDRHA